MNRLSSLSILAGSLIAAMALAQTPAATPPAGSTGLCRDGTYWTGATKRGACHGHKGVQEWYASAAGTVSSGAASSGTAPQASAPAPAAAAPASTPATAAAAPKSASTAPRATQAPGAAPGLVWVNTSSKVYHCPTDRWYGKTKNGQYMSEADAIAQGDRADHGKACAK